MAGGYTGPVTVVNESRTVQATNGVFSDAFANGTAVHIYQVPNTSGAPDSQKPTPPTTVLATATSPTTISVTWTASTDNIGVTGYDILRYNKTTGGTATTASVIASVAGTTTTYVDNATNTPSSVGGPPIANTTYGYIIKAKDAANNISDPSSVNTATPGSEAKTPAPPDTTPPTPPGSPTATVTSPTAVRLSWLPSTDNVSVAGYNVYRNGSSTSIKTDGPDYQHTRWYWSHCHR
ncbi:MAG: hypothetical protein WDN27_03710 [Candidatus Saccharibacteria bacterium]